MIPQQRLRSEPRRFQSAVAEAYVTHITLGPEVRSYAWTLPGDARCPVFLV